MATRGAGGRVAAAAVPVALAVAVVVAVAAAAAVAAAMRRRARHPNVEGNTDARSATSFTHRHAVEKQKSNGREEKNGGDWIGREGGGGRMAGKMRR